MSTVNGSIGHRANSIQCSSSYTRNVYSTSCSSSTGYSYGNSNGFALYSRGLINCNVSSQVAIGNSSSWSSYGVSNSVASSGCTRILNVGLQLVVGVNEDSLKLIVAVLVLVENSCVSVVIAEGLGVSNNGIVVRLLLVVGVNANLNGVRSQSPSIILTVDNLTINANLVGGGDDALILNSLNLNYCEVSGTYNRGTRSCGLNLNVRVVSLSIGSDDRVLNKVAAVCRARRTVNVQGNFLRAVPDGQLNNSVIAELGVDAVGNVTVSGRVRTAGREAACLNCQSNNLVVVNDVLNVLCSQREVAQILSSINLPLIVGGVVYEDSSIRSYDLGNSGATRNSIGYSLSIAIEGTRSDRSYVGVILSAQVNLGIAGLQVVTVQNAGSLLRVSRQSSAILLLVNSGSNFRTISLQQLNAGIAKLGVTQSSYSVIVEAGNLVVSNVVLAVYDQFVGVIYVVSGQSGIGEISCYCSVSRELVPVAVYTNLRIAGLECFDLALNGLSLGDDVLTLGGLISLNVLNQIASLDAVVYYAVIQVLGAEALDANLGRSYGRNLAELGSGNVSLNDLVVVVSNELDSIVRVYLVVVGDVGSNLSSRSNFASTIGAGNCIADSRSLDSTIKVGNDYVIVPSLCSNIVLLVVELDLTSVRAGLQIALNDVVNLGVAGYIDTEDGVLRSGWFLVPVLPSLNSTETSSPTYLLSKSALNCAATAET